MNNKTVNVSHLREIDSRTICYLFDVQDSTGLLVEAIDMLLTSDMNSGKALEVNRLISRYMQIRQSAVAAPPAPPAFPAPQAPPVPTDRKVGVTVAPEKVLRVHGKPVRISSSGCNSLAEFNILVIKDELKELYVTKSLHDLLKESLNNDEI